MSNQPDKKPGRPLKFKTVKELVDSIDQYFGECNPHIDTRKVWVNSEKASKSVSGNTKAGFWTDQEYMTDQQPYTILGLARALDTTRETLLDYESGKYDDKALDAEINHQFSDTIKRAKALIGEYVEKQSFSGNAAGAIFNLKNNFGYHDKTEVIQKRQVEEDLDELDDEPLPNLDDEMAEVADGLKENKNVEARPKAEEQAVAPDAPVQDSE